MRNTRRWMAVFIATSMLLSCGISYYQVRNKLSGNSSQGYDEACDIKYFISIEMPEVAWARKHKNKYIESTQEIFDKKRCAARRVDHEEDANFKIRIAISYQINALPQEWLTGLSFGLIPSWGTRPGVLKYTFGNMGTKQGHTYFIDEKSYGHILLFPISWITFITLDEMDVYKKTLTNFLEGS
jgi:hypothetical protein